MSERVSCTIADGVADVRLTRPEKRNALDRAMVRAIIEAAEQVGADPSVRVAVLSGDGKAFCAGLDTSLFAAMADPAREQDSAEVTGSLRVDAVRVVRLWTEPRGASDRRGAWRRRGRGFQLALGADIRIVAPDAQLGVFEIKWGIVPDMCGTQLLPPLVGPDVAKDLMFTARVVTGVEAKSIGLATRLADDPRADALELAAEIVGRNPDAIKVMKRLVDISWASPLDAGLRAEQELTEGMIGSANQLEAVMANLEQRPGNFVD